MQNLVVERPVPIPSITGVRFLLALYVVVFHYGLSLFQTAPQPLLAFLSAGYSAVSMFFALSGYVLAYNHLDGRPIQVKRFWIARLSRVVPAFFTAELLCLPFAVAFFHHLGAHGFILAMLREVGYSFLFLQAWFNTGTINYPAWSLSCEIFFYCLFPLFALPLYRLNKFSLRVACAVLILLTLTAPILYLSFTPDGIHGLGLTERALTFPTSSVTVQAARKMLWDGAYRIFCFVPVAHLPIFLLGAALGRYRRAFLTDAPTRPLSQRLGFLTALGLLLILLFSSGSLPHIVLHDSAVGILFCFCLLFFESAPMQFLRLLETRTVLLLGEASYAMYVLQIPFGLYWAVLIRRIGLAGSSNAWWTTGAFIVTLTLISASVFEWIERPARLHLRKLAYGGKPMA